MAPFFKTFFDLISPYTSRECVAYCFCLLALEFRPFSAQISLILGSAGASLLVLVLVLASFRDLSNRTYLHANRSILGRLPHYEVKSVLDVVCRVAECV